MEVSRGRVAGIDWLNPGVSRRCNGSAYCQAEGPTFTVPVLSVGHPDAQVLQECSFCAHFVCGVCAKKEATPLTVDGYRLALWSLNCPRCGMTLGGQAARHYVIH